MAKRRGSNSENRAETRARLLDAAERLFGTDGYDATPTARIVAEAGVAQGSLFFHFRDKRGLFIAAHDLLQERLIGDILVRAERAPDARARFDAIWRGYLEAVAVDPVVRRILLIDGPRVVGLVDMRARDRETALGFFTGEVAALVEAGALACADIAATANLLFGALDQAAFTIADFPDDAALHARLATAFEDLLAALRPRTGG